MITIFTGNNCVFCDRAKQYFQEHLLEYEERNIANDTYAFDAYQAKFPGQMSVPVIEIDDEVIVGFDLPKIKAALKLV